MSKQKVKLTKSQRTKYGFGIFGVILLCFFQPIVGIVMAVMLAKQKKKWQQENMQKIPPHVQKLTLSTLPNMPEQLQDVKLTYREANGGDLFELCKQRNALSVEDKLSAAPIAVRDSFGKDDSICVLYALQYGQTFEERTYAVWLFVDENGETGKAPFAGQIIRKADGSTELLFVDNDDFAEVIFGDMNARMESEMKAKGIPTASDEEQSYGSDEAVRASGVGKGRLGRLKSRFKSGVGEAKKTRVSAFISVAVMYGAILIVALAVLFPIFRILIRYHGIRLFLSIRSITSLGYLLVVPSFLLYFGAHNPFNFKKSVAKLLITLGIILMIVCDVIGIVVSLRAVTLYATHETVNRFIVGKFIPIALCVSTVAYILVYLVWCKGLSSKWYAAMAYVTTVLFPVATALILAAIALYIAWTLLIWLLSAIKVLLGGTPIERGFKQGWSGKGQQSSGYEIIDESGYRRTLTPYEGNRYRDDTGAFWVSDDGGNSFRRD